MWKGGGQGKEMVTTTTRGEGCCNKGREKQDREKERSWEVIEERK